MDSLESQLETDIKRFLENIQSQTRSDQIRTLRQLFDKYLHLNTCDYMMDHYDLAAITGSASTKFSTETFPVYLGKRKQKVSQNDLPKLCLIEATIGHLNKNGCLKKLPKFDKKEDKF